MAEPGSYSSTPPTAETELAEIATFGYERARDELVNVVKMLEQGGLDLDESLALWERGEALANRCEEHLAGARKRVEDALSRTDLEDDK
ncbi:exodeoxyribonuclease VII small subunit [Nocardia sp. NPDC051052]|uniref:exodeoxyribonuclease VII small subunit n=1 Tax=Nocardia sp. NPDC051052 TaxID=3364322 RepID=UPI0037B0BD07